MPKGEELMDLKANLKGVSAHDVAETVFTYLENVRAEEQAGAIRRDCGTRINVENFLERWQKANMDPTAVAVKELVVKHFSTG
jgi:hypothetical protein